MAPRVERHGRHWIISEAFAHDGIQRVAYWGGNEWVSTIERILRDPNVFDLKTRDESEVRREVIAAVFPTKAAALKACKGLPPIKVTRMQFGKAGIIYFEDSRTLDALLTRSKSLRDRGRMADPQLAQFLENSVRGGDKNSSRGELICRLSNLCEAAEALPLNKGVDRKTEHPTIVSHRGGYYSIGDSDKMLFTERDHKLADAFIGFEVMGMRELREATDLKRPADALRHISKSYGGIFAAAITFAGVKGTGYRMRIRRATST